MRGGLLLGVAILAASALVDLRVALRGDRPMIPEAVMASAARKIEEVRRPGDLLVHSPLFFVREIQELGDLPLRPDRPLPELLETRRTLVLELASHPMFGFGDPAEIVPIGEGVELRIFEPEQSGKAVLFELHRALEAVRVRIERPRGKTSCDRPRSDGGLDCPGEAEWLYAAPRVLGIGGVESLCVWAHPTADGAIVFELPVQPPPPAGRRLRITVSAGMTDEAVRSTPDGAPVTTEIRQDGELRGKVVAPNRVGWHRATFDIAPHAPVELVVTALRDGRRHHCINAAIAEEAEP